MLSSRDESDTSLLQKAIGGAVITLMAVALIVALAGAKSPVPATASAAVKNAVGGVGGGVRLNVEAPFLQSANAEVAASSEAAPLIATRHEPAAEGSGDESADMVLGENDNGQTVRLAVGQTLAIKLKENRTTGFGWAVESKSDPAIHGPKAVSKHLELLTDKSLKSSASIGGRRLIGAPGEHVFMFRAKSVGSDVLYLTYRRPWLPVSTTDPGQTYEVNVQITEQKTA